jgi:diguanylate cyclase (GGDEF)-like protein
MITASRPREEANRLAALRATALLETPHDYALDYVTNMGARLFDVPICMISLVDAKRQWIKSCVGLDVSEMARSTSFCGHVVANGRLLVIEDALRDVRFADNPWVVGSPRIRFYAGYPIRAVTGEVLGTVCLIDTRPRELSPPQLRMLREFTALAQTTMLTRKLSAARAAPASEVEVGRGEPMIDPVLGIWSRGGIEAIAEQQSQRSLQCHRPLSILILALDHFPYIIDSHGHLIGDRALRAVARELWADLRATDDIGRFGDDKLLLVLQNTTGVEAERLARRINEAVVLLRLDVPVGSAGCSVRIDCTVTIGGAERSATSQVPVHDLIRCATLALHTARERGGNCVVLGEAARIPKDASAAEDLSVRC